MGLYQRLVLAVAIAALGAPFCTGKEYCRPPPSEPLPLSDVRLMKKGGAHDPEQIMLALAGPGIAISWVTFPQEDMDFMRTAGNESSWYVVKALDRKRPPHARTRHCEHLKGLPLQPTVQYGLQPGDYQYNATGVFDCYNGEDYESGALHHVVLGLGFQQPLAPGTTYYYRCGDPNLAWSHEYTFRTSPLVGVASLPYTLGVVGDLGQTENSVETLEKLMALQPDSVVLAGDLSYADGYQPRWDSWGRLIQPYSRSLPWMMIEGNHEIEVLHDERGFLAYESRFYFPTKRSGSPFYYSYEVAGVHILMLGSYVDYEPGSQQYEWLVRDLARVDRQRTPWLIAVLHVPWYSSNMHHHGEGDDMMAAMEDLLFENGLDLLLAGHVHAYERSVPVLRGRPHRCGVTHIVVGDGGNREGLDTSYLHPTPSWSARKEASYGLGVLRLENASHAVWQWHRNGDGTFEAADEVVLERTAECRGPGIGASIATS